MRMLIRVVAAMQLALIIPAALFLAAVLVGTGSPPQYELAGAAHRVVAWYVARSWTLWLLLLALPFAALIGGAATLLCSWHHDAELPPLVQQSLATIPAPLATLVMAGTTMTAAGILAVVALHMLAN
jgi:hypothetical protein